MTDSGWRPAAALVLNVRPAGGAADNLWSLIYRGAGFVGGVPDLWA